eukprot:TRINITY_DN67642_c0_g1_i4.p1 TRINITY_DN67642_c0_g1~~TRINITY_DN67642_c0_g1_i4.p1  ORF type:complete len:111 (+),score=0.94 TRINITY_DN67642_c0_g1_i4:121-453(+)
MPIFQVSTQVNQTSCHDQISTLHLFLVTCCSFVACAMRVISSTTACQVHKATNIAPLLAINLSPVSLLLDLNNATGYNATPCRAALILWERYSAPQVVEPSLSLSGIPFP